jgi:hypothetical protein
MFVRGVVVTDDVDFFVGRCAPFDQVKEAQPFLMPVLVHACANDAAVGCVHCCKQGGRADLRLQCVAPAGVAVSVSLTIRERIEAAIGAIRPGRVLSLRMPANPICTYRYRQRPTFPGSCPNRTAIFLFSRPSAASKIIAALSLARTGLFLPLLSFSNVMRSLTDSSMLAATLIRNV